MKAGPDRTFVTSGLRHLLQYFGPRVLFELICNAIEPEKMTTVMRYSTSSYNNSVQLTGVLCTNGVLKSTQFVFSKSYGVQILHQSKNPKNTVDSGATM